jgi:hypothetical protein
MAVGAAILERLRLAYEYLFGIEVPNLDEPGAPEPTLSEVVAETKTIPATDMDKKRILARYFQSEEGSKYTKEERKAAYDELLGAYRNRGTIG